MRLNIGKPGLTMGDRCRGQAPHHPRVLQYHVRGLTPVLPVPAPSALGARGSGSDWRFHRERGQSDARARAVRPNGRQEPEMVVRHQSRACG
jgi:hypothetical protein